MKLPIVETAQKIGISITQCRYWSQLLEIEISKQGRIAYIPAGSENVLAAMKKAVEGGLAPGLAAAEVKNTFASVPVIIPEQPESHTAVIERIAGLESAIMLLVVNNQTLIAQNRELAAIVSKQSRQIDSLSVKLFPPPVAPTKKTEVNIPLLRRLWLELVAPEKLRATP